MYNIPQFNESPVIQTQQVESAAPGLEALAQGLKGFAQGSSQVAVTAGNWRSNALMYHEMAALGQLEGEYVKQFELAESPEQVQDLMAQYRAKSTELLENTHINQNDKRTMTYMAGRQINGMERMAGDLEARMTRGANRTTLFTDLPQVVAEYQKNLYFDVEHGESEKDLQTKSQLQLAVFMTPFDNALAAAMISQEEHEKALSAFLTANESAEKLFTMASEGKADAAAYHQYTYLDGKNVGGKPANFTTQGFQLDNQESGLLDDWIAQAHDGKLGGMTYMTASPKDSIIIGETFEGIRAAKGLIGSNMPIPVIEARFNELNNEKSVLTTREKAERDQLQKQLTLLKTDYQGFLDTTTLGAQLTQTYREDIRNINNSAATNEQKYEQLKDKKNQLASDYVSIGKAMGIPTQYIKPAQAEDVQEIKNAFEVGADPRGVEDVITSYNQKNAAWLANGFGNQRQFEIVQAGSLARNKDSRELIPKMVAASQKGQDYSAVDKAYQDSEKQSADLGIQTEVATQLKPVFDYLESQPRGGERIQAILDDVTNYVKFEARGNNDLAMKNLDRYVQEGSKLFLDANPIISGNGYSFNGEQVNLSNGDLKSLVSFVQNMVHENRLKNLGPGKTKDLEESGSYIITNTPTGEIIAIDDRGNLLLPSAIDLSERLVQGARGYTHQQNAIKAQQAATLETNLQAISKKQKDEILGAQVETMIDQVEATP